jgi:flagellum-specific ATP synthase
MSAVATKEHKVLAGKLKNVLATYNEAEDLINIGAYKNGSNKNIDYAISKIEEIHSFLQQDVNEKLSFEQVMESLSNLFEE